MQPDPYSLDRLHDIARQDPVSWWPPAVGWWFLIALACWWLLIVAWLQCLRWRSNAYRRAGVAQLRDLQSRHEADATTTFIEISALLKRVAIAAYPRRSVASLSGGEWLAFLVHTGPRAGFTGRPAELLVTASSHAIEASPQDVHAICQAARQWILEHDPGAGNADF